MNCFLFFLRKPGIFQQLLLLNFLFILVSPPSFSQEKNYSIEKFPSDAVFINKVDKDGTVRCELASDEEMKQLSLTKLMNFNYTIVRSLNPQSVRGLKILLRATDQLLENKEALLAFRRAAARWERYIRTEITVVIDVDYGETRWGTPWGEGVLGSTSSALYIINGNGVAESVGRLKNLHPDDVQLQTLYNAIPVHTPSTANSNLGTLVGGIVLMQAWGYFPSEINPDLNENPFGTVPSTGFNSDFDYDFDPSDGIDPGAIDFDGVVTHEIGHALGHVSIIGDGGPPENWFLPWDLFRVRPEAVEEGDLTGFGTAPRVVTPGPPPSDILTVEDGITYYKANQVFFDGLKKLELSTATGSRTEGDGQQASHWRNDQLRPPSLGEEREIGIMDPVFEEGRDSIRVNDLRMFEVIGYKIQYVQDYAEILVVASGDTIDVDKYTDTLHLGDAQLNSTIEYQFEVINMDLDHSLNYESEIIIDFSYPKDNVFNLSLESPEGSISGGTSSILKMIAGNSSVQAKVFGTLRLHTNDENRLVIELPFEFSVGGASVPLAVLSENNLGNFEFNPEQGSNPISKSFNLLNKGTLDLTYRLIPSLSARSDTPFEGLNKNSNDLAGSVLSKFFNSSLLKNASVIYQNNFETGMGGFTAEGSKSEDWKRFTLGAGGLEGHTKPTTAYFGVNYGDSLRYRNHADATLKSPGLDFSSVPPEDKVVLTFNYYLKAEEGYDFASVLVSLDNGNTFEELATSNNGILHNTDAWESVMIELPNLSGNPENVYFAFRFTSDELVEEEGLYIDDIEISTVENANTVYTIPRSGVLQGPNNLQEVTVTVNGAQLDVGYYRANILLSSNDYFNPEKSIAFNITNLLIKNANVNTLYASTGRGTGARGKVISIDLNTGAGTELGPSGFEPLKSITINPSNNEMFAFVRTIADTTSKFIRINAEDGFGLYLFESVLDFTAMAFDNDNTLYLTTDDRRLYKLNPATGDSEFVANIGINVSALAINPTTGEMWASVDESTEMDRLYKIDKTTGDTILVGKTGLDKKTRGLVFGPEDELYGVTGEETSFSSLIKIDKSNGTAVEIGGVGFRGVFGLAYKYDTTITVNPIDEIPNQFELSQNYPNPFNPSTTIRFGIPEDANVKLTIYNLLGQEVATLVNSDMSSGYYSLDWNALTFGKQISSGIYFYSINATGVSGNKFISIKKMILLK